MKINNKKGEISEEVIFVIPKIIFLTAALFAVVILVKMFIVTITDVREVESNILINRMLYSKDGLAYFDNDILRVYPGIIDIKKFELMKINPNILESIVMSYGNDNPIIASRIILKRENKEDITIFYNKDRFDKWEPRALSTVRGGAGSVKSFKEQKYVLTNDGGELTQGILDFYTIS